eukprot:7308277-Alexandrium_andersonii.AAC.1
MSCAGTVINVIIHLDSFLAAIDERPAAQPKEADLEAYIFDMTADQLSALLGRGAKVPTFVCVTHMRPV